AQLDAVGGAPGAPAHRRVQRDGRARERGLHDDDGDRDRAGGKAGLELERRAAGARQGDARPALVPRRRTRGATADQDDTAHGAVHDPVAVPDDLRPRDRAPGDAPVIGALTAALAAMLFGAAGWGGTLVAETLCAGRAPYDDGPAPV